MQPMGTGKLFDRLARPGGFTTEEHQVSVVAQTHEMADELHAIHFWHLQVAEDDVYVLVMLQKAHSSLPAGVAHQIQIRWPPGSELHGKQLKDKRVIIYQQDFHRRSVLTCSSSLPSTGWLETFATAP
jgi:hypothetical protein